MRLLRKEGLVRLGDLGVERLELGQSLGLCGRGRTLRPRLRSIAGSNRHRQCGHCRFGHCDFGLCDFGLYYFRHCDFGWWLFTQHRHERRRRRHGLEFVCHDFFH